MSLESFADFECTGLYKRHMNNDYCFVKIITLHWHHSFLDPFGKGGNRKGGNEKHFQMKGGNGGNVFFLYSKKQRFGDPFYRWPAAGGFFLNFTTSFSFFFWFGTIQKSFEKNSSAFSRRNGGNTKGGNGIRSGTKGGNSRHSHPLKAARLVFFIFAQKQKVTPSHNSKFRRS